MPNEPKKQPKKLPTYEDIERELGLDKMAFFSEMVRPDQHEEREGDADLPSASNRAPEVVLDPEHERAIIEHLEARPGPKVTPQGRDLALDQARLL
jgi:hypothetical protein